MTDLEKEAIERINNFKSIKVLYGRIYAMHKEQLEQLQKDIETALNLIEKQQREKELHIKLEQQYKKEYLDAKEGNEKKDKIIELMAKDIKEADEFLDSRGYLGEYAGCTIDEIIEEYKSEDK